MIKVTIPSEFRQQITLRSYSASSYVDGIWIDGAATDRVISASVQPLSEAEYRRLPEGYSGKLVWQVHMNFDLTLGVDGSIRPDEVLIDGTWFKLIAKDPWMRNGYSSGSFVEVKA